jgi:hypothetical protein
MEALGMAGIDGERVSLTGPAADEAAHRSESREAETKLLSHILRRAVFGSGIGALLGLALGLVGAPIALEALDAELSAANIALCAGFGAFVGSIPGALVGYISSLQPEQPWMLTFQESAGEGLFVGVHTENIDEAERAALVLAERSDRVRRIYGRGLSKG